LLDRIHCKPKGEVARSMAGDTREEATYADDGRIQVASQEVSTRANLTDSAGEGETEAKGILPRLC